MAHTYDLTTSAGKVRLLIGDTVDGGAESLTDDEIDYALELSSDVDVAAYHAAQMLYARLRVRIDQNQKGVSANGSQKMANTKAIIGMLRERIEAGQIEGFFGGISQAENDTHGADSDFPQPSFTVGMDDNPGLNASDEDDDA